MAMGEPRPLVGRHAVVTGGGRGIGAAALVLVNNAGIAGSSPLKRTDLTHWRQMLDVNATGTFLCTRQVVDGMTAAGWGRIVNIASVAALRGYPYIAAYTASKHAVLGLT